MSAFIFRRLLLAIPTLFGVLVIAFLLLYVAPGDPVMAMVGERADEQTIARLRAELRLDDPLPVQFGHYVAGIAKGDLGRSYITNRPILKDILERFPKTLELAGAAMLFATIFAVTLHWLPPSGFGGFRYLILPALALGMRSVAFLARMTRSAMLDALGADYVRTARAKGLRERVVVARHALRNALIPIITVLGLDFGAYLTGSILTETIFSWPGLGRYVVNAITRRDLPAIQGSVLFLSAVFVLVNLLTDLAYAKADPRVTYA